MLDGEVLVDSEASSGRLFFAQKGILLLANLSTWFSPAATSTYFLEVPTVMQYSSGRGAA